jgi:hypothetical protein
MNMDERIAKIAEIAKKSKLKSAHNLVLRRVRRSLSAIFGNFGTVGNCLSRDYPGRVVISNQLMAFEE